MTIPGYMRPQADGVVLFLKVQPRASTNQVGEPLGNELRVKVTAPPVDAAANEAVVRLLAEHLDCPRSAVELVRGHTSRHKSVLIRGASAETLVARLVRG